MKRRLTVTLLCLLAGLYAVDRLGGLLMEQVAHHTRDVLGPKLCDLERGLDADVVLIGASRCHHHYVPSILSGSLGLSVYNAGVGGSDNIFSHCLVLRHVLSRHVPRVVCLELMTADFAPEATPFLALSFFAPLFGRCAEADSLYRLSGTYWRYQVSHLYRYNAKAASNILGLFFDRQREADHGYMPLPRPSSPPSGLQPESPVQGRDSLKLSYLQQFITLCRQHRIRLVFTVSPKLTKAPGGQYAVLKAVARANGIPFLDYHSQGLYHDHKAYFKDFAHLCDPGARQYSLRFAADLKRIIDNPAIGGLERGIYIREGWKVVR